MRKGQPADTDRLTESSSVGSDLKKGGQLMNPKVIVAAAIATVAGIAAVVVKKIKK